MPVPTFRNIQRVIEKGGSCMSRRRGRFKLRKCCNTNVDSLWNSTQIFQACLYYNRHCYPRPQKRGGFGEQFNVLSQINKLEQENIPRLHWYTIDNCNVKDISKILSK